MAEQHTVEVLEKNDEGNRHVPEMAEGSQFPGAEMFWKLVGGPYTKARDLFGWGTTGSSVTAVPVTTQPSSNSDGVRQGSSTITTEPWLATGNDRDRVHQGLIAPTRESQLAGDTDSASSDGLIFEQLLSARSQGELPQPNIWPPGTRERYSLEPDITADPDGMIPVHVQSQPIPIPGASETAQAAGGFEETFSIGIQEGSPRLLSIEKPKIGSLEESIQKNLDSPDWGKEWNEGKEIAMSVKSAEAHLHSLIAPTAVAFEDVDITLNKKKIVPPK